MDRIIVGYARALRAAGVEVSMAETLDAANAVALVGYRDRARLKDTLGAVLAKSTTEKRIHADAFERYFDVQQHWVDSQFDAVPDSGPTAESESQSESGGLPALLALAGAAGGSGGPNLGAALFRAGEAADVDSIGFRSQLAFYTQRLLDELGIAPLNERIRHLVLDAPGADPDELDRLQSARQVLGTAARNFVEQRYELYGRHATESFMQDVAAQRDLRQLTRHDSERMRLLIDRMARRMAVRHSHRRRVDRRGRLDFRRILRSSSASDGVPHQIHFKSKRRDKPKFVALCDVSGSVAGHVRFLLLLLHSLHASIADIRSFAFAADLAEVTGLLDQLPFDDAMARILAETSGSTDYGGSLNQLRDTAWDSIDRRTTVIVLGDGRSNFGDPRTDILAEIAERAKRVLWLCPEPVRSWGTGDSCMLQYRSFCTQATHVASLVDLERAIDEALSAY